MLHPWFLAADMLQTMYSLRSRMDVPVVQMKTFANRCRRSSITALLSIFTLRIFLHTAESTLLPSPPPSSDSPPAPPPAQRFQPHLPPPVRRQPPASHPRPRARLPLRRFAVTLNPLSSYGPAWLLSPGMLRSSRSCSTRP